jgi:hypothetical protein
MSSLSSFARRRASSLAQVVFRALVLRPLASGAEYLRRIVWLPVDPKISALPSSFARHRTTLYGSSSCSGWTLNVMSYSTNVRSDRAQLNNLVGGVDKSRPVGQNVL